MKQALKTIVGLFILALVAGATYLKIAPPELLLVGTNYSAKIVCSNVFIAGRDADEVLAVDVQAPGHPLLKFISIDVNENAERVTAKIFGYAATAVSQHREGLGCSNLHNIRDLSDTRLAALQPLANGIWPEGNEVDPSQEPKIQEILSDKVLLGEGFRAAVVVKNGRIIGEAYGDGFDANSPLLGWSMTKTVTAGLIGTLIQSGKINLKDAPANSYPAWNGDGRKSVTVEDMLAMASALEWNESYGDVSDVTRMLFLNDDMAGFASGFGLGAEIGSVFNYSSGTSTMLARVWQDATGEGNLSYPQERLFKPLGMASAVMETDANDTFVGSSYMYATARDWARYGQFLLQKGIWNGEQLLPDGFTDWMFEPVEVSKGQYTKGHMWLEAPGDAGAFEDAVWMRGHDGQSIAVIPSHDLVVVRLGLTPKKLGYSSLPLAKALIEALGE